MNAKYIIDPTDPKQLRKMPEGYDFKPHYLDYLDKQKWAEVEKDYNAALAASPTILRCDNPGQFEAIIKEKGREYLIENEDMRIALEYHICYKTPLGNKTVSIIANDMNDCYSQFEAKFVKPAPQLVDINSEPVAIPMRYSRMEDHSVTILP